MSERRYVFLYVIADRKRKEELEGELYRSGGALVNCVYGHGYYESRNILDYLGFGSNRNKAIITSLIEREKGLALIEKLDEEYSFKKRDTGFAFVVPVDTIMF